MDILKCYKTLGLPPDATEREAKKAYRKLVNHWHPDRFARDDALHQLAEEQFQLLNIAYAQIQKHQSNRPRRYRSHRSAAAPWAGAAKRAGRGLRRSRPSAGRVPAVLNRWTRKFRQMLASWVSAPTRPVGTKRPGSRSAAGRPARGNQAKMSRSAGKNFDQVFNEVAGPDAANIKKTAARKKRGRRKSAPSKIVFRKKRDSDATVVTPVARVRRVGKIRRV